VTITAAMPAALSRAMVPGRARDQPDEPGIGEVVDKLDHRPVAVEEGGRPHARPAKRPGASRSAAASASGVPISRW
jgi:hypothetical protein